MCRLCFDAVREVSVCSAALKTPCGLSQDLSKRSKKRRRKVNDVEGWKSNTRIIRGP